MKRPLALTIIAWMAIIGGGLQILGSLGLVGIGSLSIFIGPTGALEGAVLLGWGFPVWTGIVLVLLGAVGLVFGLGALAEASWSWMMGIFLYGLNLAVGIALIATLGIQATPVYIALLSAVVLGYLFTAPVRAALGHPAGGMSGQTPHAV